MRFKSGQNVICVDDAGPNTLVLGRVYGVTEVAEREEDGREVVYLLGYDHHPFCADRFVAHEVSVIDRVPGKTTDTYSSMNHLNLLGQASFENAKAKGFYPNGVRDEDFPTRIALIHSELSEALEEYRNGHLLNEVYEKDGKPEGVPIEIADAIIRMLDMSAAHNIDIDEAVRIKMKYNSTRPHKHGGKKV